MSKALGGGVGMYYLRRRGIRQRRANFKSPSTADRLIPTTKIASSEFSSVMRLFLIALLVGATVIAHPTPDDGTPNIGQCPKDCWNEAAADSDCDPNEDDDCLCGPFFDNVTTCVSQTCSITDNLATLDFLEPACL
ncbi:hypothetical protein B0J11DRAFT_581966 [Dendryphion nanum]|uniref:CFEM domain-containing protein n=1 Tax=Dendryphion nanum TaxID=256645 RepID=A0A9P9IIB6_9PLEO|nr:hypothetical protein B0J11DRAFT_581966 [Dendryphion nanum]